MATGSAIQNKHPTPARSVDSDRRFWTSIARAFAGALLFGLPMLMTMELWFIGFYASPWKLALLLIVMVPLLTGLSYIGGFEPTETLRDDIVDAFVGIAVATVMAVAILAIFGVITSEMSAREIIGKVILQTFSGGIGAVLAEGQMSGGGGKDRQTHRRKHPTYGQEMFLMLAGALFLALNVAPTDEIVLLSYLMNTWQQIGLLLLSLVIMHGFVYSVEFRGKPHQHPDATFIGLFLRFTLVGYVLVLAVSLFLLWIFGRVEGQSFYEIISACLVLSFPGAIGAASARLVL